jgi:hypothetical protein
MMPLRALLLGLTLGMVGAVLMQRVRRRKDVGEPAKSEARGTATPESATEEMEASEDLSALPTTELYRRAQLAGIAGRSRMTKTQLIEALRDVTR